MSTPSQDLLAATLARLGSPPRRQWEQAADPPIPAWLRPNHPLRRAEADRRFLIENGVVVLSWVVMANTALFEVGNGPRPGLVVYAPGNDVDVETLADVANAVFALRQEKAVDPELATLQAEIANDQHCFVARPVPAAIAHGSEVRLSGVVVHRDHLPRPYLGGKLLPLLVHDKTPSVVILPAPLWGDDLRNAWIDLAGEP